MTELPAGRSGRPRCCPTSAASRRPFPRIPG